MLEFLKHNPLVEEARAARLRPRGIATCFLLFFLVMTVTEMVATLPSSMYVTLRTFSLLGAEFFMSQDVDPEVLAEKMNEAYATVMAEDGYILLSLFSMLIVSALVIVFCRFIERRSISSMGLAVRRRSVPELTVGLIAGLLLAGITFLILYATRALTVAPGSFSAAMLILYFFAFLIQGTAEEILLRGYFMISLTAVTRPLSAAICSSLLFSLLHVGNVGSSFLSILNVFLFGLLLGLITFRTGSLWVACALHGVWNFAEGNLFGMPVSGILPGHSLLLSTPDEGRALTNGGAFGPEGGAVVTLVLLLAFAVFFLLPPKRWEAPAELREEQG